MWYDAMRELFIETHSVGAVVLRGERDKKAVIWMVHCTFENSSHNEWAYQRITARVLIYCRSSF